MATGGAQIRIAVQYLGSITLRHDWPYQESFMGYYMLYVM